MKTKANKIFVFIKGLKGSLYRNFFIYLFFGLGKLWNDSLRNKFFKNRVLSVNSIKKILLIHTLSIGDTVVATPLIRAIKEKFPKSRLTVLISPVAEDILKFNSYVDEIILYSISNRMHDGFFPLAKKLFNEKFDLVFDSQIRFMRLSRTILSLLSRARYRVGFKWDKYRGCLNNIEVPLEIKHGVDQFLDLAKGVGIKSKDTSIDMFLSSVDEKYIDNFLSERRISFDRPIIVIHPGNLWKGKCWKAGNFAKLIDYYMQKHNYQVVITGDKQDLSQIEDIVLELTFGQPYVAAGMLSIGQLSALIKRASLLVCIDTCVVHIAAGLNLKTIALYGQSYPRLWHPWNKGTQSMLTKYHSCGLCRPNGKSAFALRSEDCKKDYDCINDVTVEEVIELSEELLKPLSR